MGTPILRRTAAKLLTESFILKMKPGQKHADGSAAPGFGRLIVRARVKANGGIVREFFFRYHLEGKERSIRLGTHGQMTLDEARAEANARRELVRDGKDPQVQRTRDQESNRQADELERRERRKGSLGDLIGDYIAHLRASGKVSADDVERTLRRHVIDAFPALAAKPAKAITIDDVTDILARMIARGIERRVNIVRALLRAAFAFGAKRDNDPERKAQAMKDNDATSAKLFDITWNPVANVPVIAKYEKPGERTLSDDELRHYWSSLSPLHPGIADALRVALLLGGQRLTQLKRLNWRDYDPQKRILALRDTKGRGDAREHLLPVSEGVAAILATLRTINTKEDGFIFSTMQGETEVHLSTLSSAVTDIARKYWPKDKSKAYSASDLRRTVETRLAALGISKDIRAQLLSHGRTGGVQDKHYDRHDYIPEKAAALAKWEQHLDLVIKGEAGNVVQARFGRRGSA